MSGENTSNRKRKQETTEQHDSHLQEAREKARAKRAEETPEQCDCWLKKLEKKLELKEQKKHLNNVIIS